MILDPRESQALVKRACESRDIPTLAPVLGQARRLLGDNRASARQIADALRRDQVLSAKILRLANSSHYAFSAPVTDVRRALQFVGGDTLRTLLLGTGAFADAPPRLDRFDVRGFWKHSLATALLAENLARRAGFAEAETHFTCGLLHDIGKLALYRSAPEVVDEVVRFAFYEHVSFLEAEQKIGLPGHTLVGERIAAAWGLPAVIRRTLRYHHRSPQSFRDFDDVSRRCLLTTVVSNRAVNRSEIGFSGNPKREDHDPLDLDALAVTVDELRELAREAALQVEGIESELRPFSMVA